MSNQQLFSVINNNNFIPSFTNPIKEISITNDDELTLVSNNYIQEYNLIKQQNLGTLAAKSKISKDSNMPRSKKFELIKRIFIYTKVILN